MQSTILLPGKIHYYNKPEEKYGAHICYFLPVDVVFDHLAQIPADEGPDPPGLAALQRMLKTGRCWVKLSAPYRVSQKGSSYGNVCRLVAKLLAANSDRLVWGSDWPHTSPHGHDPEPNGAITPFRQLDTGHVLNLLAAWIPDERVRRKILVDNPARLYMFT